MLTWHKTEIGHELARTVKPPHVTDLRNHACRDNGGNAAERLQRFDHCTKRPFGQKSHDFPLDSHFSFAGLIHGIEIGLDCSSPPAQIPACAANAPGSSLGF